MNAPLLIALAVEDVHRGFRAEIEPLTAEQLLYRPTPEANTITFLLWHYARTTDNTLHRQARGVTPLWEQEEWYRRFEMQPQEMGSGFTGEQVGAFHPVREDLMAYYQRVWDASRTILGALTEEDLDRVPNPERPQATLGRSLMNIVVGHGFWHLGDVRFLKGLQGMPFGR